MTSDTDIPTSNDKQQDSFIEEEGLETQYSPEGYAARTVELLQPKGPWYDMTLDGLRPVLTSALFSIHLNQRPPADFKFLAKLSDLLREASPSSSELAITLANASDELDHLARSKQAFQVTQALMFLAAKSGNMEAAIAITDWLLNNGIYKVDASLFMRVGFDALDAVVNGNGMHHDFSRAKLRYALFSQNYARMLQARDEARKEFLEQTLEFALIAEVIKKHPAPAGHLVVFGDIAPGPKDDDKFLESYFDLEHKPLPLVHAPDPGKTADKLRQEFPWCGSAIDLIERQLELSLYGDATIKLRPLLLHGVPGTGKSRFARRLAENLELPFICINGGGASDSMLFRGAARGWGTGRPGIAPHAIQQHKIANPMILVDEIDKEGESRHNGKVSDVLHQLLERETSVRYYDEYLLTNCNLSRINWLATANRIDFIEQSLLSRFDIVEVPKPKREHYHRIFHTAVKDVLTHAGIELTVALSLFETSEIEYACSKAASPRHLTKLVETLVTIKLRDGRSLPH